MVWYITSSVTKGVNSLTIPPDTRIKGRIKLYGNYGNTKGKEVDHKWDWWTRRTDMSDQGGVTCPPLDLGIMEKKITIIASSKDIHKQINTKTKKNKSVKVFCVKDIH